MRKIACLLAAMAFAPPAAAETLAITHAEAWTMETDAPVADATILIEDGHIVSVVAGGGVPDGARVVDAQGRRVTPGLVNAATQIGLVEISGSSDTVDTASRDDHGPGYDVSAALNGHSTLVSLARADGLTRAIIYPSPSRHAPFSGEPALARLRDGVDILDRANVGVYAVIGGGAWERLGSRAVQWAALRHALDEAREEVAEHGGERKKGGRDERGAGPRRGGQELIRDVVAGDAPLAIETHRESDLRQAIALARDYDIRVVIVGGSEAWRVADALAAAKIAVILDPQANLPFDFDQLGVRQDNAAILAAAGVRVAIGRAGRPIHVNYNAGMGIREGAGIAVANGLPYAEALRAVTVNPLAIWGQGGGTLAAGADADLVIWDGDPLEPSSNAVEVIVEGRDVSTRSRQDLLAERYRDAR